MYPCRALYTVLLLLLSGCLSGSSASDSITTTQLLKDPDELICNNANFKIGFFSPTNSTNRYLGVWYSKKNSDGSLEVVWVANRDKPLTDSSGMLKISDSGDLQVLDAQNTIYWSSNVSSEVNSSVARLLNTGNFVLLAEDGIKTIWQSFDHPTDSFLPNTTLVFDSNRRDGYVQSWKSSNDPSRGRFSIVHLPRSLPEIFVVDADDNIYYRTGSWSGYMFLGTPFPDSNVTTGFTVVNGNDGTLEITYTAPEESSLQRFFLSYDGRLVQKSWVDSKSNWEVIWQSLGSECDVYRKCGEFTVCNAKKTPICECLKGFVPKKNDEWSKGNWTNGCVRRTPLQCNALGGKSDKFLQYKQVKLPDYTQYTYANQDNCQSKCSSCSCLAYSYYPGIGCILLNVSLFDMQQVSGGGADLFLRLAYSEVPGESGKQKIRIAVIVLATAFVTCIIMYFLWRWKGHKYAGKGSKSKHVQTHPKETEFHDLPLFEFTKLVIATDDFSLRNKLGQGGFGLVYKGILEDGEKIAVKRLSRASGQGLEEFMNEVVMISKLQHKNLVRLLGCCVEGEEKLLVYELLPNKSLDAIIFDQAHSKILDWPKRFEIIQGICRGLLYLHRDSRLRIIHRDLKTSNILLDEELNPKISDFGMARIVGSKQDQASTQRVVGTYGYMSPEYAMEGRFSEKSDVFSLGVLILEIVSGRKNSSFQDYESSNLLAFAWKLWNSNDILTFIDPTISDPSFERQIIQSIQAGLLCVQEFAVDRPNVSALMTMLDATNIESLPQPNQPGFTRSKAGSSSEILQTTSNDISLTAVSGR